MAPNNLSAESLLILYISLVIFLVIFSSDIL